MSGEAIPGKTAQQIFDKLEEMCDRMGASATQDIRIEALEETTAKLLAAIYEGNGQPALATRMEAYATELAGVKDMLRSLSRDRSERREIQDNELLSTKRQLWAAIITALGAVAVAVFGK